MVLLTIVTNSNPHTLYFDHPIEKPSYIRLLSASLYNSWHNLKEEAIIPITDSNGTVSKTNMLPGHYTLDSLVNEFNEVQKIKPKLKITAVANTPVGSMAIYNQNKLTFSNNLLELLGLEGTLFIAFLKRLTSPSTYFVHCDLIDIHTYIHLFDKAG